MIVAARATHREPKHGAAGGAKHVIHGIVARAFDFVRGDLRWEHARTEKARRGEREWVLRLVFVAGELPLHELVIGHVHVQCFDDKVAKVEGVGAIVVLLEAGAFGKARYVQPVTRPALTVGWGRQEFVDDVGQG